jgi:hypothetical protein
MAEGEELENNLLQKANIAFAGDERGRLSNE